MTARPRLELVIYPRPIKVKEGAHKKKIRAYVCPAAIASRLDADTSGCVIFARDREAWEALRGQLAARTVEKVYLALVAGRVSSGGVCSVPLSQRGGRSLPVEPGVGRRHSNCGCSYFFACIIKQPESDEARLAP